MSAINPPLAFICRAASCAAFLIACCGAAHAADSLTYLETAGRYGDLEDQLEQQLARGVKPNSTLLSYLCIAHGKLKRYGKLFDCAGKLEQSTARGDTAFELDQHVMFVASSDARPLPETLRAQAYFELGEYAKAIASGTQALEMLARIPETGGTSLYPTVRYRIMNLEVLALAAVRTGNEAEAKRLALQLEDVSRPFIGGRMWGWIKNNALARVYMAMGRYREALEYIPDNSSGMKMVVSFVNGLGPYAYRGDSTTTVIEIPRLVMRGKALAEIGQIEEARASFDEVLASTRITDIGDLYWVALFERGRIAEADRQPERAVGFYRQAVDVVEMQRSTINTEASKIGFVGDKQALYARLVSNLVAAGKPEQAFEYVERSKSRALVDMLSSKKDFSVRDADLEKIRLILEQLDVTDLPATIQAETAGSGRDEVRNLQLARSEVRAVAPELSTLVTVSAVPAAELRNLLAADETLVEFYYHANELVAFVANRRQIQVVTLDAAGLEGQIRQFRDALLAVGTPAWQYPARDLYRRLWQPLEGLISTGRVTVVAHGALHYLPFAALQRPDGKFLNDRYGLRFLPSASVLKFLRPPIDKGGQLLALGNPDLGDPKLDLVFAESEVKAVAALYPRTRVALRREASETLFREVGAAFSRLHFATHGKFEAADPLSSGIYLAADAGNNGVLTVSELYSMSLNADLVTLSACETGLGEIASGDDVVGLTRGFLYAGSGSIVASLWSVDDRATGELMKIFYTNLAVMNKEEALRQAQIKIRETFPHPYFWAPFQLTGRAN